MKLCLSNYREGGGREGGMAKCTDPPKHGSKVGKISLKFRDYIHGKNIEADMVNLLLVVECDIN